MKKRILSLLLCLVLLLGVLPIAAAAAENPFVDVSESDYCYDAVLWAYETGVTVGVDATHFGPDATVTRGQAVTFLWRAMGEPEPRSTENPFADVKESDWFYKPVLWAVEQGITVGTDAAHFSPAQTCSTMHIITFLYRTLGMGENGWGQASADWAANEGLLSDTGLTVETGVNCPRAAVVTTLDRTVGDAADLRQLPEGVEALEEDPQAEKSETVTDDDSAALTVDTVDVTAGTPTELNFELTSSLYVDSFALLLDGSEVSQLTDEDGDGVYTGTYTVTRSADALLRFTASVTVSGRTLESNAVTVTVTEPIRAETEQVIDEVLGAVEGLMQSAADGLPEDATEDEKAAARADAIYDYLQSQSGYWVASDPTPTSPGGSDWVPGAVEDLERDEFSISYTIDGVHFGAECRERAPETDGEHVSTTYCRNVIPSEAEGAYPLQMPEQQILRLRCAPLRMTYSGAARGMENLLALSGNYTTEEKAVVFSYYSNKSGELQAQGAIDCVRALRDNGYNVTPYYNFRAADLRELQDYALIIIRSHGSICRICTQEQVTSKNVSNYAADLKADRVRAVTKASGLTCYDVKPSFFTHYYRDSGRPLNAKFVYVGLCEGRLRSDLADALTGAGADAVVAFDRSVYTEYTNLILGTMLQRLCGGETVVQALAAAQAAHGRNDAEWYRAKQRRNSPEPPATAVIDGAEDTTIHARLRNGAFEKKNAPGEDWNWLGAARPVSRLGAYGVYGGYAAYLSTGRGAKDGGFSMVSQRILIPEDATTLSFCYRVFSEEPNRSEPRHDYFIVSLSDAYSRERATLLRFDVNARRSLFVYSKTWLNYERQNFVTENWYKRSCDIRAYRGKILTLSFCVNDVSDSIYDTAVLIDNIVIQ